MHFSVLGTCAGLLPLPNVKTSTRSSQRVKKLIYRRPTHILQIGRIISNFSGPFSILRPLLYYKLFFTFCLYFFFQEFFSSENLVTFLAFSPAPASQQHACNSFTSPTCMQFIYIANMHAIHQQAFMLADELHACCMHRLASACIMQLIKTFEKASSRVRFFNR